MSAPTTETLAEGLRPLTDDPDRGAILCDIDGVLAPIVRRADEARVPPEISRLLGRLARRYGLVACVSRRPAAEARRLVGVALAHLASATRIRCSRCGCTVRRATARGTRAWSRRWRRCPAKERRAPRHLRAA